MPIGVDIFPYIRSHFTGDEYRRAMDVVEREELKAAENIQLQPGIVLIRRDISNRRRRADLFPQFPRHSGCSSNTKQQKVSRQDNRSLYRESRSGLQS